MAWQRNLATTTANPRNLQQFALIKIKLLTQKHTHTVAIDLLNDSSRLCVGSHLYQ